jgi:hypothetical protein
MFRFPITFGGGLVKIQRRFFWQGRHFTRKYHMIKWKFICRPKENGGLGIFFLEIMNISLLCKWWWKIESSQGPWKDIVHAKYVHTNFEENFPSTSCYL